MDIANLIEQGSTAVISGALVAGVSWVKMGSAVKALEAKVDGITKSLATCQAEREFCRKSMREHHEKSDFHVGPILLSTIEDIRDRLIRIENRLMNGIAKE